MATLKVPVVIDGVKTIEELANRVLDEFEYNGKTIREWADLITNPKTNADRIRSMSDEELATWLTKMQLDAFRMGYAGLLPVAFPTELADWLDWLKQEVIE